MKRNTFEKLAKDCHSEAALFHVLAAPLFSRLGLWLVNNPHERFGRFGYCSAEYELQNGLALSVGIEPVDGRALTLRFGRRWFVDGKFETLSNSYFVFGKLLGIELPKFYDLGFEEELISSFWAPIADIERSWEILLGGLTESVIDQAEHSMYGAVERLRYRREANPDLVITVADLRAPAKS